MKIYFITCILLASTQAYSIEHSLAAHEHGAIKLGIAVAKNIVDIDLDGPTESFISFEYLPKTAEEKRIFNNAKDVWEKKVLELIHFENKLNCKITESTFKQVIDEKETAEEQKKIKDPKKKEQGVHSDIEAKAKITCNGNIAGSVLQVSLKKQFKNIKKLTVDVISNETKSIEITAAVQSFKI
jgi:hypothetical protein